MVCNTYGATNENDRCSPTDSDYYSSMTFIGYADDLLEWLAWLRKILSWLEERSKLLYLGKKAVYEKPILYVSYRSRVEHYFRKTVRSTTPPRHMMWGGRK